MFQLNSFYKIALIPLTIIIGVLFSCSSKKDETKDEQIRITSFDTLEVVDTSLNSIHISLNKIATVPQNVILTGLPEHRLVTIYKAKKDKKTDRESSGYSSYDNGGEDDKISHFMPGLDILYGYNLFNIAHYDLKMEKLNFLFTQPVLIKTLYYPSFEQDSLDKKPINRNYYLVSAYDEDTNKDTLINKKDLRRFYYFNSSNSEKIQLIPADYSVVRSQYDPKNDVMYIFASHDANKNGIGDREEPINIFWINLKAPSQAKRMY